MNDDTYDPMGAPAGRKQGWSTSAKILLILGIIAAVCCAVCCGGIFWFINNLKNSVTTDPVEVVKIQQEMIGIDLPEGLQPAFGMSFGMFNFNWQIAMYGDQLAQQVEAQGEAPEGLRGAFLMLMQMQVPGADPAEFEGQLRQQANAQGGDNISIQSSEARTVEVDGEEIDFQFAQGTNNESGEAVRVVSGAIRGRGGPTMLMYVVPEEQWDEEAAMHLLQSIRR